MRAWIVMPTRNEAHRIGQTLKDYSSKLRNSGIRLAVVSSSTDRTDRIVSGYTSKFKFIRLLKSGRNDGKGGAIIKGFRYALKERPEFIGFVDADDSVKCSEMLKMVSLLERGERLDGVIASRYVEGSRTNGVIEPSRFLASRAYNLLIRLLFGIDVRDTQCGAKIFRRKAIESVLPRLSMLGMSFDVNLLYELKLDGYKVKEHGVVYDQANEGTNVNVVRNAPEMLVTALGFRIYKSRLARFLPRSLLLSVYRRVGKW